jgi:GntR family transcriptional regulator
VRTIRYREIADDLRGRLAGGEFASGGLLPSEAELAAAYRASRVTIRRALEELRTEGLVGARQGFGWFAAGAPLRQRLARLGTIEDQLTERGLHSARRILSFHVVDPPADVAAVLGPGKVLEVVRLNLADSHPFARVTVWCPRSLAKGMTQEQLAEQTFYDLLPAVAGRQLGDAVQTIAAAAADPTDAELLEVPVGSPVLVCRRVTSDAEGVPVLVAVHVFPGLRTEFVADLARPEASIAPSGLRLVD